MTRIIALILALAFASPAVAADPSCPPEASMDGLKTAIQDAHGVVLGGAAYDTADGQTVIIANLNGRVVFGLEIGGCVSDPAPIPGVTTLPTRLSGRQPDGSVWA